MSKYPDVDCSKCTYLAEYRYCFFYDENGEDTVGTLQRCEIDSHHMVKGHNPQRCDKFKIQNECTLCSHHKVDIIISIVGDKEFKEEEPYCFLRVTPGKERCKYFDDINNQEEADHD